MSSDLAASVCREVNKIGTVLELIFYGWQHIVCNQISNVEKSVLSGNIKLVEMCLLY